MAVEFKHALRRLRGQIIGWAVGVALYSLVMAFFFPSIGQMENIDGYLSLFPKEMFAFFENLYAIGTPLGYL
ncbi:MAG: hypothetical protein GX044_07855, partial [Firmicutes bacterium]|nr:hypothetical protein [Bacillota bacterium]